MLEFSFNVVVVILPLNHELFHFSSWLGHARVSFYDIREKHVLSNWINEVQLMLGILPRTNSYVYGYVLNFNIICFFAMTMIFYFYLF